jgi:hypothetical protein
MFQKNVDRLWRKHCRCYDIIIIYQGFLLSSCLELEQLRRNELDRAGPQKQKVVLLLSTSNLWYNRLIVYLGTGQ